MRILIVSEDVPYQSMGGLAKHALNLARALVRAGHEVDFLGGDQHPIEAAGEEGRFGGRFFGELNGHLAGWKEHQLGMYLPPKRTWLAQRFARIILRRAAGYDVIHYHGHVPNVARFLPQHINFVQTRHDQGSDCLAHTRFCHGEICESTDPEECASCITARPNALQRKVSTSAVIRFRREVAESFRRHKTIFVSDKLRRNFSRTAGPGPWGAAVHNFVDTERLKRARESAESPRMHHGLMIFIAAKLYAPKGIELFLRELTPRLRPDMRVTIAGDGPDEARLRAEFESHAIHFLGWCTPEQTLNMAATSDAVVVPSILEESCPTTVLEGLLLGKATFALALGGTPELDIYAASPDQLRLHSDMRSLVADLVTFEPRPSYGVVPDGLGGADHAVRQLLHIYRLPPGQPLI
jgi:glycogen(starch) synthase